jgi:uncharacterized protein YndB with AHSA1/START domain
VSCWGPHGFTTPRAEFDLNVGAGMPSRCGYRREGRSISGEFIFSGEFLEVDPPSRLVYTFLLGGTRSDDRETASSLDTVGDATEVSPWRGELRYRSRAHSAPRWLDGLLEKLRDLMR